MRILLCGDSYYDFDERFPGLHWADQLNQHEVYRIARGGASNFSIYHQVQHAKFFNPDLVLISFTSIARIEYSKQPFDHFDLGLPPEYIDKQWLYRNTMYKNIEHANPGYNTQQYINWMPYYIEEFESIKNGIYIKQSLDHLTKENIKFYYTLGGYNGSFDLGAHAQFDILPNSWDHSEKLSNPYFHIQDPKWHADHAEFILNLIRP
jgi:hypothetical protein